MTSLGNQRKSDEHIGKFAGRDGSVGIATWHGLDCPGMESRWGFKTSRPVVLTGLEGLKKNPRLVREMSIVQRQLWDCARLLCLKTGVILDNLKEVLKSRIILFVRKHNSHVSLGSCDRAS